MRYVDDTLPLVNKKDINLIHGRLSSFDEKIKFTIDNFTDGNGHFLDIQIDENNVSIYFKTTNTRQQAHFHSQTLWSIKTAWIKALFQLAERICSTNAALYGQIKSIKELISQNSQPKEVRNSLLQRLKSSINKTKEQTVDDCKKSWLNFPYLGDKGGHSDKEFNSKIKQFVKLSSLLQ